jgi:predicted nucleic acid-binding Zn ribbon protein
MQAWAKRAHRAYPDLPVTTCHDYEIAYKYRYQCGGCSATIGRHSKSLDTQRMACSACSGRFTLLLVLRKHAAAAGGDGGGGGGGGGVASVRKASGFSLFVQQHFARRTATSCASCPGATRRTSRAAAARRQRAQWWRQAWRLRP